VVVHIRVARIQHIPNQLIHRRHNDVTIAKQSLGSSPPPPATLTRPCPLLAITDQVDTPAHGGGEYLSAFLRKPNQLDAPGRLRQSVGDHVVGAHVHVVDHLPRDTLTDEVMLDFDMLGSTVEDRVLRQ